MPSYKTQGSNLYFIDPTVSDPTIRQMECPTGITGLGGPADQIDETCLDDIDAVSSPGIRRPGVVTVPFVLKSNAAAQAALVQIDDLQLTTAWFIGLSGSSSPPTADSDDEHLIGPNGRRGFAFRGYIAEITLDIAGNEVVRGTMTIQRVGGITPYLES